MRPNEARFKVFVVSPLSSVAGRMKLNGINRFLNEGYSWDIELARGLTELSPEMLEGISPDGYDGIFLGLRANAKTLGILSRLGVPSVLFGDRKDANAISRIPRAILFHDDVKAIVRAAYAHFNAVGKLASYGFVPARAPTFWSMEREEEFVREMERHGIVVSVCGEGNVEKWLLSLPKPAGVLCAFDDRAADVLIACRRLELSVPDDVAVLGIGNDAQICESARPRLSSVSVDFEAQGYRAARELHAMMCGRRVPVSSEIVVGAASITARASTLAESTSGALVRRAVEFISANAQTGIGPKDVVRHLHVSRRLLDLRFREVTGKSVQEAIRGRRLAAVRKLLSSTTLPIAIVAERCGYRDANYLKNQFKKAHGMTMRDYRRQSQA